MLDINKHIGINAVIYTIALIATSYLYKSSNSLGKPDMKLLLIFGVVILSLSLLLTPVLLAVSAGQKCGDAKPGFQGEIIGRGILVGMMTYLVFLAFHFISVLQDPFMDLFNSKGTNGKIIEGTWFSIGFGIAFYCVMVLIVFVTINYYDGLRSACKKPIADILKNVEPYLESQRYLTEEDVAEDEEIGSI